MLKVLITGATSGNGEAFVHYYGARGDCLHLLGRNNDKLLELRDLYQDQCEIFLWQVDLANRDERQHFLNQVQDVEYDVVINNAGFGDLDGYIEAPWSRIESMIETNITAMSQIAHVVLKTMAKKHRGSLLNVASLAGYFSGPYMATYYATKNYVLSLSQSLAVEMKPFNVYVGALCPGPTPTKFGLNADFPKMNPVADLAKSSIDQVVNESLRAMNKNKVIIIPKLTNKVGALLSKLVPRMVSTNIIGHYQHKARMVRKEAKNV